MNSNTNLAEIYKAWLRYEETSIMDNLNRKIPTYVRVWKGDTEKWPTEII